MLIVLAAAGTWLRKATRGFCGPRERAKPISRAMAIGYTTRSVTSSGERRRIWMSLISSQRTVVPLVPALAQEGHEGGLEVQVTVARADGLLEPARGAGEHQLPVGEHEHAIGVALGLLHVVGRVHDGGAALGQSADELPQALALAWIQR